VFFFNFIFLMLWFFTWLPPMTYNLALHLQWTLTLLYCYIPLFFLFYLFMVCLRVVWTTCCLRGETAAQSLSLRSLGKSMVGFLWAGLGWARAFEHCVSWVSVINVDALLYCFLTPPNSSRQRQGSYEQTVCSIIIRTIYLYIIYYTD